jgi:hypothetical protein
MNNGAGEHAERGERDDSLLDALLDETLGGRQPPDLSDRIVRALAANRVSLGSRVSLGRGHEDEEGNDSPNGNATVLPAGNIEARPIPISTQPHVRESGLRTARPARSQTGRSQTMAGYFTARHWLGLAASVAVLAGGYWTLSRDVPDPQIAQNPIARQPVSKRPGDEGPAGGGHQGTADDNPADPERTGTDESTGTPDLVDSTNTSDEPERTGPHAVSPETHAASETQSANDTDAATESPDEPHTKIANTTPHESTSSAPEQPNIGLPDRTTVAGVGTHPMSGAVNDADVIAMIDRGIRQRWREQGLRPSPAASDAEWCRRVFLDVIGRIPTIDELETYLVDHARDKRAKLVQRLLNDDSYAEAYARHWTTIWTNLLVGRSGGMLPDSPVNREGLQQYLRRSFLTNKPYDVLTFELISAQGSNTPGEYDFNGAVNFVLDNLQEKAATATAKTAQIFLGLQIQCTQCHNHPFNDWKQNRFWELNAFFRQAKTVVERKGSDQRPVRLVDEDFAGEGAHDPTSADPDDAEIYYELRNGELRVAYPVFVDGTAINPSGLVRAVNRRYELARFVMRSEYLGQAIVNRLWGHFFGYGFTKPVDDLGSHNPASHPELLGELARDFADGGHDLKRLIRWITLSEAYSLSSRFGPKQGNQSDDPTLGTPPSFSHFYLRQMTAEQLYDSLLVATEAHRATGNYEEQQRTKDDWAQQFTIAFGTDDNGEMTTFDGTITQALMMMNGELTRRATSSAAGGFLWKVSQRAAQPAAPIKHLYQAALGRKPSKAELKLADELLATRGGNRQTVLEDVWWALLNSNEFILNH